MSAQSVCASLDRLGYLPEVRGQFARYRRDHDLMRLVLRGQPPVLLTEPQLRTPRDIADGWGQPVLAGQERLAHPRRMPIGP